MTSNIPKGRDSSSENKGFLKSLFSRKFNKKHEESIDHYENDIASALTNEKTEDEKNGNIEKLFDQQRNIVLYKVFSSMRTALLKNDSVAIHNAIVKVLGAIYPLLLKIRKYDQKDSKDSVYLGIKDLATELEHIEAYLRQKRSISEFSPEEIEEMDRVIQPFLVFGLIDMENVFRGTYAKNLFNREKNFTDQIEKFIVENSPVKVSFDLPKQEETQEELEAHVKKEPKPVYIRVDHDGVKDVFLNQTAMNRFLENTIQESLQHLSPGDVLNVTIAIQKTDIVLTLTAQGKDEYTGDMLVKPLYAVEKKMEFLDPIKVLEKAGARVIHTPTSYKVVIPTIQNQDTTIYIPKKSEIKKEKDV